MVPLVTNMYAGKCGYLSHPSLFTLVSAGLLLNSVFPFARGNLFVPCIQYTRMSFTNSSVSAFVVL